MLAILLFIALACWCWRGTGPYFLRWPLVVIVVALTSGHPVIAFFGEGFEALAGPLLTLLIMMLGLWIMLGGCLAAPDAGITTTTLMVAMEGGGVMTVGKHMSALACRCPICGRLATANEACPACGGTLVAPSQQVIASVAVAERPTFEVSRISAPLMRSEALAARVRQPVTDFRDNPFALFRGAEVSGRVIILRQAPQEPMDFDPWRWVAIPAWGLLLLIMPLAGAIIAWQSYGLVSAVGVAVVSLIVLRFVFSDRLLQSWHLTAALNGRHIVEPMPVLMVRLRQWDEREVQLRLKGQLDNGTIMEGDRIRASGRWRSGVFRVRYVFCERTGAQIVPRQPNAFLLACVGVGLLIFASLWLLFSGWPWVAEQFHHFRSSMPAGIPHQPVFNLSP